MLSRRSTVCEPMQGNVSDCQFYFCVIIKSMWHNTLSLCKLILTIVTSYTGQNKGRQRKMKIPEFKNTYRPCFRGTEGVLKSSGRSFRVSFKKWKGKRSAAQITEVKVLNEHGAKLENRWEAILHWKQINCLYLIEFFIVKI